MKRKGRSNNDEMRPEYDFDYSKAVRGKYYRRLLKEGTKKKIRSRSSHRKTLQAIEGIGRDSKATGKKHDRWLYKQDTSKARGLRSR